ncbi:VOC family protein [Salinispira pacifica]
MQKISPFLWFDDQAEEAATLYTSVFPGSRIVNITKFLEAGQEIHGRKPGSVQTVWFELDGYSFTALNGGPMFTLNPSISFFVNCRSAGEVDELAGELSPGGQTLMELGEYPFSRRYAWIQDKFGVSWQLMLSEGEPPARFVPCLLFVGDKCGQAEEAIELYTSIFGQGERLTTARYGADQPPNPEGSLMYADFRIEGQVFAAMDSARPHQFGFNEAISFVVDCRGQAEVDRYWTALSAVPEAEQCGWLKDKFGISWQIVPREFFELLESSGPAGAERVTQAMLGMKKLNIADLEKAAKGI